MIFRITSKRYKEKSLKRQVVMSMGKKNREMSREMRMHYFLPFTVTRMGPAGNNVCWFDGEI